jgi:hypothetical protein
MRLELADAHLTRQLVYQQPDFIRTQRVREKKSRAATLFV